METDDTPKTAVFVAFVLKMAVLFFIIVAASSVNLDRLTHFACLYPAEAYPRHCCGTTYQ